MGFFEFEKDALWKTFQLLKHLILLRTNKFVQVSEEGVSKDKLFYFISMFGALTAMAMAMDAVTLPTNLLFSDPTMPDQSRGALIFAVIPPISTCIFSHILSKRINIYAVLNLYLTMSFCALVFIASLSIIKITSGAINDDYQLMKIGQGDATEAFGMTCGNLERKAEQVFLQRKLLLTLSSDATRTSRLPLFALDSESLNEAMSTISLTTFYRSPYFEGYTRIEIIESQIISARVAARDKYRSEFFTISILLCMFSLISIFYIVFHNYRLVIHDAARTGKKSSIRHFVGTMSIILVFASGAFISSIVKEKEPFDHDRLLSDINYRNLYLEYRTKSIAAEINSLRVKFAEYAAICPRIDPHGLW